MAAYTALEPIRHNGVDYAPGAPIDLDAKAAGPLLAVGAIAKPNNRSGEQGDSPEKRGAAALQADSAPPISTGTTADVVPIGTKTGKGKPAK